MAMTNFRGHQPMTEERRALAVQQFLARGGVLGGVPSSTQAAHDLQRHEPPKGYTLGLAKRQAERGLPVTTPRRRAAGEIPKPFTEGIAARRAAGTLPPAPTVARSYGNEPPKPWSIALEARR